jgi:hypothetical protein
MLNGTWIPGHAGNDKTETEFPIPEETGQASLRLRLTLRLRNAEKILNR